MNRRSRVTVAYDGSAFHGFAEDRLRTVMGVLRASIETIVQQPIHPVGAGRTDAGVHARNMRAHFDLETPLTAFRIMGAINAHLRPAPMANDG